MAQAAKTRFDAQLPVEQKQLFEQAATVGGFRSLTEFVFSSAQKIAEEIIARHEEILASERDRQIFFDAMMSPPKPNQALLDAAEDYKKLTR